MTKYEDLRAQLATARDYNEELEDTIEELVETNADLQDAIRELVVERDDLKKALAAERRTKQRIIIGPHEGDAY